MAMSPICCFNAGSFAEVLLGWEQYFYSTAGAFKSDVDVGQQKVIESNFCTAKKLSLAKT